MLDLGMKQLLKDDCKLVIRQQIKFLLEFDKYYKC